MKKAYPTIKVGRLRQELSEYPDDMDIDFCGLEYHQLKQYGSTSVQLEFVEQVYLDDKGNVVVQNLG